MSATLLSLKQVAEHAGVKLRTVRGWVATKELRAVDVASRPGSDKPRYKVRPEDLEQFLDARSTMPAAPKPAPRRQAYRPKYFAANGKGVEEGEAALVPPRAASRSNRRRTNRRTQPKGLRPHGIQIDTVSQA